MMSETAAVTTRRWTLTWVWLGYWAFLFVITHIPLGGLRLRAEGGDKVIHFLGYFVLVILAGRAAIHRGVELSNRWFVVWGSVFLVYAGFDELLQEFVNRTPSWKDWYADAVGVIMGLAILFGVRQSADNQGEISD